MDMAERDDYRRDIKDVAEALLRAKARREPASILLGAGASVSAGIPLAHGFVEEIERRFPAAHARAVEKTYPHAMREINDGERHDLIAEHVGKARLNWAHILLGWLVHQGYVGKVLTTNFDNLALRCTGLYQIYPAVYDVTALASFDPSFVRDPAVFFLHGQHSGFVQLHTQEEVTNNAERLQPVFADASVRRPWLVLGYSGDNDPVFECLTRVRSFRYGLYWMSYRDSPPSPAVSSRLLGASRQAYLVPGYDADGFMIALFRALGLELPPLLRDPFAHGLSVLEQFAPFPTAVREQDFTLPARTHLLAARRWFVDGVVPVSPSDIHHEQTLLAMQGYLFRGDYDAVIAAAGEGEVPPSLRRLVAIALGLRAARPSEALREALRQGRDDPAALAAALADLDRAIAMAPELAELYTDRAAIRLSASEVHVGDAFDALLAPARADLEAALERAPELHAAVYNLAYHDALIAQRRTGPARREGLERAVAGFRRAMELDPEDVMTLVMAARALVLLARDGDRATLADAQALLQRAEELQPRHYELLVSSLALRLTALGEQWSRLHTELPALVRRAELMRELDAQDLRGRLLLGLLQMLSAMLSEAPEARARFDAARAMYTGAIASPQWTALFGADLGDLRWLLGAALWMEAEHRGEDERAEFDRLAEQALATAVESADSAPAVLRMWGLLLSSRAADVEGPGGERLLDAADDKFRAALALRPDDPEILVEWADARVERIERSRDAREATAWYEDALALLRRAKETGSVEALEFVWADLCGALGEALGQDSRALPLLREAMRRYKQALAQSADQAERWSEYAGYAESLAELLAESPKNVEEARQCLRESARAYARANELEPEGPMLLAQAWVIAMHAALEGEHGKTEAAQVLFQQAEDLVRSFLRRDPSDRDAHLLLLHLHDGQGRTDDLVAALRDMARLEPPVTRAELAAEDFEFLAEPPPALRAVLDALAPE